ncbi:MAG: T9SS type A sorting domain-containing protein [Bacteroidia bacterium]|nr:T9SS type A sorting domain-containing protein [Bacteroidia bacterium]
MLSSVSLVWAFTWAQLSGTYLINGTTDLSARSFATLQAAFDELARSGAQDTVRLSIVSPYHPAGEPPTIRVKGYSCQNCEVIVQADTPVVIGTSPRAEWWEGQFVLRIQGGVQHFTLNGRGRLTLRSLTDTSAFTGVVGIVPRTGSSISYIRIDSCVLEGRSRRSTWAAIYVGDSASLFLQPVVGTVSQLSINACTLRSARYGVAMVAPSWGAVQQITLSRNTFGYPTGTLAQADSAWGGVGGSCALYARSILNLLIEGNTAMGDWESGPVTPTAFRIEYSHTVTLRANRLYNIRSVSPDGYGAIGIHLLRDNRFGPTPHLVENNFIGELIGSADESLPGSSAYLVAGILLESLQPDPAASFIVRHNTIHLWGTAQSQAPWAKDGFSAGIVAGKNIRGGVELKGNLIQNTLNLSSSSPPDLKETCALAFWEDTATLQWSTFDFSHNFYYVKGASPVRTYLARIGSGERKVTVGSLAAWRTFSGLDLNSRYSVQGSAPFTSSSSPHIQTSVPWEGICAGPVPLVSSFDFDGEVRPQGGTSDPGTAPDIGADEVAGTVYPCATPTAQPLISSLSTGFVNEHVTLSVANPFLLEGELSLMWSGDGGLTWHTIPLTRQDFPVTLPLPAPQTLPGTVTYRLAASPLAGCTGLPDTSGAVSISVSDRIGNRPQNAILLPLSLTSPGIWEGTHTDSLTGYGVTDAFSSRTGSTKGSLSPDLFFQLSLPECLDSLVVDVCDPITDFDTRLHIIQATDTLTDRDQGYRPDCAPAGVPSAYTSRIIVVGASPGYIPPVENYTAPTQGELPLPATTSLYVVVEGETPLDIGRFTLQIKGYKVPMAPPNLGPDRTLCYAPAGVSLDGYTRGATSYEWYLDGQLLSGFTGPTLTLPISLGPHTIVVVAHQQPSQPCALPQTLSDTLVLTITPSIEATIVYEGLPQRNGDTLTLPFGQHTFSGQAQSANATFRWRLWDSQGILLDWAGGNTFSREWGIRGVYTLELESEEGDCREADTLYVQILPQVSTLPSLPEQGAYVKVWPIPTSGDLYIQAPKEILPCTALFQDTRGRVLFSLPLEVSPQTVHLSLPAGIYLLRLSNSHQTYTRRVVISP